MVLQQLSQVQTWRSFTASSKDVDQERAGGAGMLLQLAVGALIGPNHALQLELGISTRCAPGGCGAPAPASC